MRRAALFGSGKMSFEIAMQAMRRMQGSKGRLPGKFKTIGLRALSRNRSLAWAITARFSNSVVGR